VELLDYVYDVLPDNVSDHLLACQSEEYEAMKQAQAQREAQTVAFLRQRFPETAGDGAAAESPAVSMTSSDVAKIPVKAEPAPVKNEEKDQEAAKPLTDTERWESRMQLGAETHARFLQRKDGTISRNTTFNS